jgi:hypothetical protein
VLLSFARLDELQANLRITRDDKTVRLMVFNDRLLLPTILPCGTNTLLCDR